jgi:hypothetical protein
MNTNTTTTKNRRFRSSLRHLWDDQVAAHRALLRLTPYVDKSRRDGR